MQGITTPTISTNTHPIVVKRTADPDGTPDRVVGGADECGEDEPVSEVVGSPGESVE
jgi:hypothetical protein